jgi:hypothetical protein
VITSPLILKACSAVMKAIVPLVKELFAQFPETRPKPFPVAGEEARRS